MDQEYTHFSHLHNLIMHQMPEGTKVSCSGCRSSVTGTIYGCWQCNFFLHDQCYHATRSLEHPSHPSHPLALIPYPTYPSKSFQCDSCQITGTGFSYSCADCEFDLHVHCAYSISDSTAYDGEQNSIPFSLSNYVSHLERHSIPQSIPTAQNPSMAHTAIFHYSHPHNLTIVDLKPGEQNEVVCSGCKYDVIGKVYSCFAPNCNFHLHESCFHLKKQIQHKSHSHLLNLLPTAPYNSSSFICNACSGSGTSFDYHCSLCNFDLHIQCVNLPDTVKRADHEHTLRLFYSCPEKREKYTVKCNVCYETIRKDRAGYYCESCRNFDTHVGCVDSKLMRKG